MLRVDLIRCVPSSFGVTRKYCAALIERGEAFLDGCRAHQLVSRGRQLYTVTKKLRQVRDTSGCMTSVAWTHRRIREGCWPAAFQADRTPSTHGGKRKVTCMFRSSDHHGRHTSVQP